MRPPRVAAAWFSLCVVLHRMSDVASLHRLSDLSVCLRLSPWCCEHLHAMQFPPPSALASEPNTSLWVGIAAYRDPRCGQTLYNLFSKVRTHNVWSAAAYVCKRGALHLLVVCARAPCCHACHSVAPRAACVVAYAYGRCLRAFVLRHSCVQCTQTHSCLWG